LASCCSIVSIPMIGIKIHEKLTLDTPCGSTGRKGLPFFSNVVYYTA
jgi:hypothetical protein